MDANASRRPKLEGDEEQLGHDYANDVSYPEEYEDLAELDGHEVIEPGSLATDPAANRVPLRDATKAAIQASAPKTPAGDFIDPNTGQVISKEGPFDYGHKPGFEWWRIQQIARDQGWTREELIEYENDPTHYQIEAPGPNRSHAYEKPR